MRLLKASIAFTVGVAIERAISTTPSFQEIVLALIAVTLVLIAAKFSRRHVTTAVLLALLVLGTVRAVTGTESPALVPWDALPRNEQRVTLEGQMLSDPAPSKDRVRLRLQIVSNDNSIPDYQIDVYTDRLHDVANVERRSTDFRYGDSYSVSGRFILTPSREDVVAIISTSSVDLISTGNGGTIRSSIAGFRSEISHLLTDALDSKSGGLAAALLVGDRTKLHPETITSFRASGLSHVLAISGLHIAMIGGIIMAISVWIIGRQRQLYLIAPGLSIWIYAALAGLTPSVTRAAIMFTVYLLARLLGRQRSVLPPLALAATIMLAIDPEILRSISFQLSFAAVLGIALFSARMASGASDRIQNSVLLPNFLKRPLTGIVYGSSVSLAATIATAPLVAFHFGQIPIWGIPATLLIVPVLPLFIGGSVLVAIAGSVLGQPLAIAGLIPHAVGNYMSFIAALFERIPFGPVDADGWSIPLIIGWYGIAIFLVNRRKLLGQIRGWSNSLTLSLNSRSNGVTNHRSNNNRVKYTVASIWAITAISLVGVVLSNPESNDLTVTFFETNRGDMIYVETPSGTRLLIDGGDNPDLAVRNLESVLPPLDRRIDVILSTHPDADHLGTLQQIVEQFEIGTIIDSGVVHDSDIYESWTGLIARLDNVITAQPGMVIALDDEITMTVLQTGCVVVECSNFNDKGVVARLDFKDVSFLLTGDLTSGGEIDLLQTGKPVKSTVLKVGHHGSRTSTTEQFLEEVDPALAIVTTGIKNQFGHPHEDVINRLTDQLSPETVYVTRDSGTITVTTDGDRVWVTTER
ncbi:DNA internalization-related competence protein ComEC/Rec2 [Dehalococcoides mccartyi]|nr:DNA internalization-related competence protein ComEC/Rec2 [Dehalococcoides mccartyi]